MKKSITKTMKKSTKIRLSIILILALVFAGFIIVTIDDLVHYFFMYCLFGYFFLDIVSIVCFKFEVAFKKDPLLILNWVRGFLSIAAFSTQIILLFEELVDGRPHGFPQISWNICVFAYVLGIIEIVILIIRAIIKKVKRRKSAIAEENTSCQQDNCDAE